MSTNYHPPRNVFSDLLTAVPQPLRDMMRKVAKSIEDTKDDTWPDVPYHYGMGRIKAYEEWLSKLSEHERKQEIEACRSRYEKHYSDIAFKVVKTMNENGHDITPFMSPQQNQKHIMREIFEKTFHPLEPSSEKTRERIRNRITSGHERTRER